MGISLLLLFEDTSITISNCYWRFKFYRTKVRTTLLNPSPDEGKMLTLPELIIALIGLLTIAAVLIHLNYLWFVHQMRARRKKRRRKFRASVYAVEFCNIMKREHMGKRLGSSLKA